MNKELMELKLRIDCFKPELKKELNCFCEFFEVMEFFLSRDIDDSVVELWLRDYHDEVEVVKKLFDRFEEQSSE